MSETQQEHDKPCEANCHRWQSDYRDGDKCNCGDFYCIESGSVGLIINAHDDIELLRQERDGALHAARRQFDENADLLARLQQARQEKAAVRSLFGAALAGIEILRGELEVLAQKLEAAQGPVK